MTLNILDATEIFYNSVGDTYDYGAAIRAYSAVIDDTNDWRASVPLPLV